MLDLHEQTVFADYFLICETENDRQLRALAFSIIEDAKQQGQTIADGKEGNAESGWMLVDFGDLIVHIFSSEKRHFYDLENLWNEARVVLHIQ